MKDKQQNTSNTNDISNTFTAYTTGQNQVETLLTNSNLHPFPKNSEIEI